MTTLANMLAAAQRLLNYYNGDEKTAQNPGGLTGVGGMADNWDPCIQDIGTVANGVGDAMTAASTSEGNAAASAEAAADSAQSAQQDAQATAADRQATGQDRQATAADRQAVAQDKTAVHQDRLAADADAQATAADRQAVAQDKTAVHQDRLAADADAQATAADRLATQADRQQTGLDRQAAQQAAANAQTWDPTAYLKKTGDTISAAFALVTGTITNLFVGTNGRVGIGTATPGAELEIADTSGDNDVRINLRASASKIGQLGRSTTAMFIDTVSSDPFQIFTGSQEALRVLHVVGANRYPTVIPSNGGNPGFGTSAGALNLTSATGQVLINGSPIASGVFAGTSSKSTNYPIVQSDGGGVIKCTAGLTVTLPAASGLPAGWWVTLSNRSSGAIAITPAGADTVGGASSWTIRAWQDLTVYRTGLSTFDVLNLGASVLDAVATWSPTNKGSGVTLTNNNLTAVCPSGNTVRATVGASFGKRYYEVTFGTLGSTGFGIQTSAGGLSGLVGDDSNGWAFLSDGRKFTGGTGSAYGSAYSSGVTGRIAHDIDAGKIWVAIGSVWQGSGDPVTGTNPMFTGVTGATYYPAFGCYSSSTTGTGAFLSSSFAFTPPAGFVSYY